MNQEQIIHKGGAQLLANIAFKTDDAQTMRVVAGAIANLCGNEKVHSVLKEDGGIKAILAMTRYGNSDVIAQVARGLANFAKCESRGIARGWTKGKSLLINEGALEWLITMSATASGSTRRHIDLALCHLAQNGDNMPDIMSSGGIKELFRLSQDTTREDICNLAKKILNLNPTFLAGMEKPNSAT
ncbi:hypothetical protein Taro_011796 [Colocasia esculenta]|uniref:Uncharacterized protein n=1 Tax=Colocasia esculenta TaxID=4460 RepID=A0A843U795_COLES|nr:hypothetical protein [Colocasia esculenta]